MLTKLKFLLFGIFLLFNYQLNFAENIVSTFNGKVIKSDSLTNASYSFISWGHWYGSIMNLSSILPSSTLLANINSINKLQPSFIMGMGDIYRNNDSLSFSNFQALILNTITSPIFNAVGNHEMYGRTFYESHFGKTIYSFKIKGELYIVLDSEIALCELEGEQLTFLKNKLDSALHDNSIKNVFIFSHKLMWITIDNCMEVFKDINSSYQCYDDTTFKNQIYPQLVNLSDKKPVYWLSGDHGFSLFYHKIKDHNLTFLACGINDCEEDAYLHFSISNNDQVSIQAHSFVGKKLMPVENYNIDYWKNHIYHMNTIAKAQLMLYNKYFWCGIAISLLILLIGITLLRLRE